MSPDSLLLRRLATGLVAVTITVVSLLPFSFWLSETLLEDVGIRDLMAYQIMTLSYSDALPFETDTARASLRYYRPALGMSAELPAELVRLSPGIYHEFGIGDGLYHVHVRDVGEGDRAYLVYDIGFINNLQASLIVFIMALAVLAVFAVLIFSRRVVGRALVPFSDLVRQIRGLDPLQRGQRLSLAYADGELRIINDALNLYMAKLDELVERERAFAAAASHELRTPLSVIQGTAALLSQNSQIPERVRDRLERAVRQVCQELDALLALSRAREKPPADELKLDSWLPHIAETYLSEVQPATFVRWLVRQPAVVCAPPGVVIIIFSNLLRNALRASQGREIVISISSAHIGIRDKGHGIPEDELPHVFEPRFRGRDGGSGMGLYIAKSLADQYGWELILANHPEGGVEATLNFDQGKP